MLLKRRENPPEERQRHPEVRILALPPLTYKTKLKNINFIPFRSSSRLTDFSTRTIGNGVTLLLRSG